MGTFCFSVVMAVCNVEPFLAESVESVLAQDIGFAGHVQIVLVDDGSTDRSGEICDAYAARWPGNILAVHQANGGVSAARNEGLRHAVGDYVSFLDSDDKLSPNAMRLVREFFRAHGEEADIVSLPLVFFDGKRGEHPLNYKFRKGTRVIDLLEEPDAIQLHIASSFVRGAVARELRFDTRLSYAEDSKACAEILAAKPRLGVVAEARYLYRRRSGGSRSALQASEQSKAWYIPCLEHFSYEVLERAAKRPGQVPRFLQHMVMYQLQWRVRLSLRTVRQALGERGAGEFVEKCLALLERIDDEVILAQRDIYPSHKCMLLAKKHHAAPSLVPREGDVDILCAGHRVASVSECAAKLEFLRMEGDVLSLEGYVGFVGLGDLSGIRVFLEAGGEMHACELPAVDTGRVAGAECLGETIFPALTFRCRLDLSGAGSWSIGLYTECAGEMVRRRHLQVGWGFPLAPALRAAYLRQGHWAIRKEGDRLLADRISWPGHVAREARLLLEIARQDRPGRWGAIALRLLYRAARPFFPRDIWLVQDRTHKADDNGEAFFRYLHEAGKRERAYFVLRKDSPDRERVAAYGRVLDYGSMRHWLMHLLAGTLVSSAGDAHVLNPFGPSKRYFQDLMHGKRWVYLKHGIIKDDMSRWLNRYNKDIGMIVTASARERQSILDGKYWYGEEAVRLTGLPRYDLLEDRARREVAVMPTWRKSLGMPVRPDEGGRAYDGSFRETGLFRFYDALLNDPRLLECARRHGYRIRFMPHPHLMQAVCLFRRNDAVEFCQPWTRYRDLFAECALLVTDYSSVAFDFAYLGKPVIYCQFDRDTFFGQHSYDAGYFDYGRDGFGEVETDLPGTVARIVEYLEDGCRVKETYRRRADSFFAFHDKGNCERVYEAIRGMEP